MVPRERLAQIMVKDEEIPDEVKEKALKQWGQYLLEKRQRLHFSVNYVGFIKDD